MKYARKNHSSLAVIATVIVAGCDTTELHNFSINPQAVNQINLNFFFTTAQLGAASGGSSGDNRYIRLENQYWDVFLCDPTPCQCTVNTVSMLATNTSMMTGIDHETFEAPFDDFV